MGVLRVLTGEGDSCVTWDPAAAEAGKPEALAAVREAERIFAAHQELGGSWYWLMRGQPARRLPRFDPLAEEVIGVRMVTSG
jgi:hypothetical protein